jgi:chromosome segregation ATPase
MTDPIRRPSARLGTCAARACGILFALVAATTASTPALAQKSLGGGSGSGPVMTREELRACLKQQDTLKVRVADYDQQRAALDKERADILQAKQAIDADRGGVQAGKINDLNARAADVATRITEWNTRWQDFERLGRGGPTADRQRRQLLREQKELNEENAAIDKEREGLSGVGGNAKEINVKLEALNARTVAWNDRQKVVVKMGEDVTQARDLWAAECGSRRYREDDEIAIRQGK